MCAHCPLDHSSKLCSEGKHVVFEAEDFCLEHTCWDTSEDSCILCSVQRYWLCPCSPCLPARKFPARARDRTIFVIAPDMPLMIAHQGASER